MTVVLHKHCREIGYCNRGLREWCAREGFDWPSFVKNGIDADVLRATNNAMAGRAIAQAEKDEHGQQ